MILSFSDLWEKCEEFCKQTSQNISPSSIIDELLMKIDIYNKVIQKNEIIDEEKKQAKSRLFGEILLTLTNLSLRDNINVYEALAIAYQHRSVALYSEKYKDI